MSRLGHVLLNILTIDMLTLNCDSRLLTTVDIQLTEEVGEIEVRSLRIVDYEWAILAAMCCASDSRKCNFLVLLPSWT